MESVILSAYIITWPCVFLAARPMVWMSDVSERRKPLLVRVKYGHKGDLRNIQALAQKVDSHKDIKTFIRRSRTISVRSSVSISEWRYFAWIPQILHVIGQIFRHPLRQRCYKHLIPLRRFLIDLRNKIVNLALYRADADFRVQKPCGRIICSASQQLMLLLIHIRRC